MKYRIPTQLLESALTQDKNPWLKARAVWQLGALKDRLALRAAKERGRPECRGMDIEQMRAAIGDTPGVDRLLDIILRAGSHGDSLGAVPDRISIATLRDHPHGPDFGPPDELLPDLIAADGGMPGLQRGKTKRYAVARQEVGHDHHERLARCIRHAGAQTCIDVEPA